MRLGKIKASVLAAALVGLGFGSQSNAALILVGQAANTVSLGDSLGAVLTTADSVEIGWFTSGPNIGAFGTYTQATQFLSGWNTVAAGTARAFDIDGLALNSIELANGNTSLNGKQMYFIAGKGSLLNQATELLILTNSNWIVPNNVVTDISDTYSFDVSDAGTTLLWGSFSAAAGVSYEDPSLGTVTLDEYRTQAIVPEPSTGALMMIGAAGLVALRRLRKV